MPTYVLTALDVDDEVAFLAGFDSTGFRVSRNIAEARRFGSRHAAAEYAKRSGLMRTGWTVDSVLRFEKAAR